MPTALPWLGAAQSPWLCSDSAPTKALPCFLFPQPGKLTEAFKYFVQGMGYSKWQTVFWFCGGVVRGKLLWSI